MFLLALLDMASGDPRRIDEKTIKETARSRGIAAEDLAKRRETIRDPQPVPQQTRPQERPAAKPPDPNTKKAPQ